MTDNIDPMQLDPVPSGLPADTEYLGSKMDQLIQAVVDLEQATVRQETPSPGLFFVMALHNDFPQVVRVRVTGLVVSVSAACTVSLIVGSSTFIAFDFVGADTKHIPLPFTIDSGKDVSVTVSAGTLRTAFLLGYAESSRPA